MPANTVRCSGNESLSPGGGSYSPCPFQKLVELSRVPCHFPHRVHFAGRYEHSYTEGLDSTLELGPRFPLGLREEPYHAAARYTLCTRASEQLTTESKKPRHFGPPLSLAILA